MNAPIGHAPIRIGPTAARWIRKHFNYPSLLLLFTAGVFLRIILMIAYFPAVMLWFDSPRYARIDAMPIFGDFWMPAGYPIFLRFLHAISHQLWFTMAVQHAIGLSVGLMLFLVMRRLGLKPWAACLPAAVAFLSGDHLYLEHIVMADCFLIFLTAAGLVAAVRGLVSDLNVWWLSTGSVLLAAAALTRSVGVVLLPILVVCTALWVRKFPGRSAAAAIAAAVLPGLGLFGLYLGAFEITHGQYLGMADMRGWNLYSRVAPFADCKKFAPPEGTSALCEDRPPSQRPGPFGYVWDLNSIGRANFPLGPGTGKSLGAFAKQVILRQPGDYLRAVSIDLLRYVTPSFHPTPYGGQSPEIVSFGWRDTSVEELVVRAMSRGYRGTTVRLRWQNVLANYQNVFRLHGFLIIVFALLTVLGMLKARGPTGLGVFLFGLTAFALYLVPVLTVSYDFRYGIPPETFIVVSGVLGAAAFLPKLRTAVAVREKR